jgi:D-beta-D-heptose 7-phosphate kinase/D-beta-D-heptose 1-phosphate adenosyltransferase
MSNSDLIAQVEKLAGARVLCVGDVMLDRYVYGQVDRISPEAPIPVLSVERELAMLGGAGNVVRNLVALGAEICFLSVVGNDRAGSEITGLVGAEPRVEPHLLIEAKRVTTIKTRLVAGAQQLLRTDRETVLPINDAVAGDLVRRVTESLVDNRVMVLSDYGKGVLRADVTPRLIEAARKAGLKVVVDPKGRDYTRYAGADLLTPNRRELAEATGLPTDSDEEVIGAAQALLDGLSVAAVLVTRSQHGMTLVPRHGEVRHLPAQAQEVFDVSGAGDTVVATLAAALAGGVPLDAACALANVAAGLVVGRIGTATCSAEDIAKSLERGDVEPELTKLLARSAALEQVVAWRQQGLRIGFTNGCFDLLHPGHISLIAQARAACDRLVVAINSDSSVQRLKGAGRPVQNETSRALVLGSLADIDAVVLFEEDTPEALIEALVPDVLVKGADYTLEQVVGGEAVRRRGGKVLLAKLLPGHSTTQTIAKMSS